MRGFSAQLAHDLAVGCVEGAYWICGRLRSFTHQPEAIMPKSKVELRCRKCGRLITVDRADVTFERAPEKSVRPGVLLAYHDGDELRCPFHGGNCYWLEPVDGEGD